MKTKFLNVFVTATILLLATTGVRAQSAYSNEVMSLNPVGYWPMHEVEAPAPGDIETNYGTLGLLGTGFYPDWASGTPKGMTRGYTPSPIINDTATCVSFLHSITSGSGYASLSYDNFLILPHSSPLTTLNPPFSVECWVDITNANHNGTVIWGQQGFDNLNGAGAATGPDGDGFTFNWNGALFLGIQNGVAAVNPNNGGAQYPSNVWYYAVATCDANTNTVLYIDGTATTSPYAAVGKYLPDSWTPLTIGGARSGTRAIGGYVADFAVYTNVLSTADIQNKYSIATNAASVAGQYFDAVTNDDPVVYYRMNAPTTYTPPATASLPVLYNFGTTNGVAVNNGVYTAGTMPGIMQGPVNNNGVPYAGVATNLAMLSGISSFGDAGFAPAYNPTGSNANFSVTAIFRGYPCDGRFQSIMGHGTNSWQLEMCTNGTIVFNAGNGLKAAGGTGTSAGDLETVGVYNDGNWHQVVAVNQTNVISIYVDGVLDTSGTPTGIASTNMIPGNSDDVMIGADPIYTNIPPGMGRQFAGQICDAAFFTNALTAGQVQALYNAQDIAPNITAQPVSAGANEGSAFTNVVTATGSYLAYQWFTNGVPLAGQTNASLILNPVVAADASTNYYVVVTNNYGSVTSAVVSLTVYAAPTFLTQLPITYTNLFTLYAGANPSFSVSAGGALPIYYYWFTNGVLDATATGSTNLSFTNVQIGSFSNYCVVSNFVGSTTSTVWTASVIADPPNASSGLSPYPQTVLALNPIGYWRLNDTNLDGVDNGGINGSGNNGGGDDGWIANDYVGGNNGIYTNVSLGNPGYDPATDPSDTSAQFGETGISFNDSDVNSIAGINFGSPSGTSAAFTVEAWVSGYEQAADAGIVTLGYGGAEQFDLDTGGNGSSHDFLFFFRDALGNSNGVSSSIAPAGLGPWYHLVGVVDEITNHNVTFYINGLPVATTAISPGIGVLAPSTLMSIGSKMGGEFTDFNEQFLGNINDVAVYNYALSASQVADQYVSSGVAPNLSPAPPSSESAAGGTSLTIPVTALGTPPLGYYWHDENGGTNISAGATNGPLLNAALTVPSIPAAWNGDTLELVVTNAYGTTNVNVAFTIAEYPAQITLNLPSPVTVVQGNSYLYSIGAIGLAPITYQWYSNSVAVANATNSTLTVTAGPPGNTAYLVTVTNPYGSTNSATSTFTSISATAPALTSGLETNLLLLKPAGYWPMHETEAAAPGDVEVNYGSLGPLGNGYYPDWAANSGAFIRQARGPMATNADPDTGVSFTHYTSSLASPVFTNGLFIPHNSPLTTLNPPFTVECWFYPTNIGPGSPLWSQTGDEGLNAGEEGGGSGYITGLFLNWAQSSFVGYELDDSLNGTFGNPQKIGGGNGATSTLASNNWYYMVLTCDANTNMTLWTNGVMNQSAHASVGDYSPDYWTPLSICSGEGNLHAQAGVMSEFAVYTNNLGAADISNHYAIGISPYPATNYFSLVMTDNPVIYLRMDSSNYSAPPVNFWPVLFNYGSAGANGVYNPGTMPGMLPGPITNANDVPFNGLSGNVSALSGVSSFADAGYAPAFNPTGSNANFSVMATFRGNPCDGRFQSIAGHGTNSWQLTMTTSGCLVFNAGNGNQAAGGTGQAAGDLSTIGVYNDGNWHQVVAVNYANDISIYVDGVLDTNGTPIGITAASIIPGNTDDVMIGSDPTYTNTPAGVGASFAGQVCDVAFFTNALNAGEVSALYAASLNPGQVPAYAAPEPPLGVTVASGGALSLTAGAAGTANVGYQWQMITNGGGTEVLQEGAGNSPLNANLSVPSVPAAWNGGQLELTVTNAYGTNSAFVALSVVIPVNPNPTNIVTAVTNNILYLSWPADHTGWQLQSQTNSLAVGISTNWVNVSNSTTTNRVIIPINLTNGSVFYRLTY